MVVLLSLVLAIISWKFVEMPFRRKRLQQRRGKVLAQGALALLTISVSGYLIAQAQGVPTRVPPEAAAYADGKRDRAFLQKLTMADAMQGKFVFLGSTDPYAPAHTLVWGDSHAMAAMPAIDSLCASHHVRCFGAAHSSTAPLLGFKSHTKHGLKEESLGFNNAVFEFVER